MDVIKMAPLALVVSALSLSIVEGYINPQEVYSNSYGEVTYQQLTARFLIKYYYVFQNLS